MARTISRRRTGKGAAASSVESADGSGDVAPENGKNGVLRRQLSPPTAVAPGLSTGPAHPSTRSAYNGSCGTGTHREWKGAQRSGARGYSHAAASLLTLESLAEIEME